MTTYTTTPGLTHTRSLDYVTLDVFTTTRFGGNPLAIILLHEGQTPNQAEKQAIAREFNYSETVFLHLSDESRRKAEWIYDIFTTERELPFAGHPTIGTAWYLAKLYPEVVGDRASARLIAKAGPVKLSFEPRGADVYATASIPHNVHVHEAGLTRDAVLKMQPGLEAFENKISNASPVVSLVQGMTFAYVSVPSMAALRAIKLSTLPSERFIKLDEGWSPSFTAIYFYYMDDLAWAPSKADYKLKCRMIETAFGEDAATGSASAGLAAYLAILQERGVDLVRICIDQGVEMGRPSRIDIEVERDRNYGVERIRQTGSCVRVMSGNLE